MECSTGCIHCHHSSCVHKVPIFSSLEHKDVFEIAALIEHKSYEKGDVLFFEGDKINAVIIINTGSVKAYKITPDGREQILYVFTEGDFFGEQSLLTEQTAFFTVEALEKVNICTISKESFHNLLLSHPDISINIITELGKRINRMESNIQSMGIRNVDARIASLLLEYLEKYGDDNKVIRLPVSREGMANQLGIARETMSRKLSQLENNRIISSITNKSIKILDQDALVEMTGNY